MPDFDIIRFLNTTKTEADQALTDHKKEWDKGWSLFNNRYDFSKKAGWQAKHVVPKYALAVETAAAILQRALLEAGGAGDWFGVLGEGEIDRLKAPLLKKLERVHLGLARFEQRFSDGLRVGFIGTPIIYKVTWPQWWDEEIVFDDELDTQPPIEDAAQERVKIRAPKFMPRRRSGLRVELWDAYKFWPDPSGRNRYVIAETDVDLDQLREGALEDIYDLGAVEQIEADIQAELSKDRDTRRLGGMKDSPAPAWRKKVRVTEFWGDLVDEEGIVVMRDATFSVANGKYLIRRPRKNPYWFRIVERHYPNVKGPFLWGNPFRVPLSVYGKGYARDGATLADAITEMFNQLLDATLFASIDAFEIDPDVLADPAQAKTGVYSGKAFVRRPGSDPNTKAVTPIQLGRLDPNLMSVFFMLDRTFQNATAATEFVAAVQPTRQTPTLGEFQGRQAQALGLFDIAARNLEDQLLEPLLEMAYWAILQFADDFTQAEVVEALGDDAMQLSVMPDEMRFDLLKANVRFRARGMSTLLQKQEDIAKIGAFLQTVGGLAQQVPEVASGVNWIGLLRRAADALNWPEHEVLRIDTGQANETSQVPGGSMVPQIMQRMAGQNPDMASQMRAQLLAQLEAANAP